LEVQDWLDEHITLKSEKVFDEKIETITSLTNQYVDTSQAIKELIQHEIKAVHTLAKAQNESIANIEKAIISSVNEVGDINGKLSELPEINEIRGP
jgi:glutaredoxin 2